MIHLPRRAAALLFCASLALQHAGAGVLAVFETSVGRLDVELFPDDKPVTVDNFIQYVRSGRYRDGIIHRLPVNGLTLGADFVAQGGGIWVTNRGTATATFAAVPTFPPIVNEFGVGRRMTNSFGTIAMAKLGGLTNSATSHWFLNLANNSFLDANNPDNLFVVFGKVVGSTNALDNFRTFRWYTGTQTSNVVTQVNTPLGTLSELPLLLPVLSEATLVFVDIRLLELSISLRSDSARELSWTSVSNQTQHLEYRPGEGGPWSPLLTTNGNGSAVRFVDASLDPSRLYRVRVDY